jgi:hypothetical protein
VSSHDRNRRSRGSSGLFSAIWQRFSSAPPEQPAVVLAAFAEPQGTLATEWEREARVLREVLLPFSHQFRLEMLLNCTTDDLHTALLYQQPAFLHFHGHGTATGIVLEDRVGGRHQVAWRALMETLGSCDTLGCVILNACDSHVHTQVGRQPFHLITTPGSVSTEAAREFTRGFYSALVARRAAPAAYRQGCHLLALKGFPESERPILTEAGR